MASTRLSRTSGTPTNNSKWTISVWVKRANLTYGDGFIMDAYVSANDRFKFAFQSADKLEIWNSNGGSDDATLTPNRVFRDTNSWYHLLLSMDATLSTATDRFKLYVNGVRETDFGTNVNAPQNSTEFVVNQNGATLAIGAYHGGSSFFDGSMSHFHFIDGTAYDPSAFGETDSTTGEWKINTSPSVTYGNNGFFILKDGNGVTDQSGNSNNFTVAAGSLTNTEDCPSDVFATFNPLPYYGGTKPTFSNGNTSIRANGNGNYGEAVSTLAMPKSGKFYAEFKRYQNDSTFAVGVGDMPLIIDALRSNTQIFSTSFTGNCSVRVDGYMIRTGQEISGYIGSIANGDIIGIAMDLDNGAFYAHKNGTYGAVSSVTGVPTSGSSKTGAIDLSADSWWTNSSDICFHFGSISGGGWDGCDANFGNGFFGTTAISSEGTNASGIGKFEYDVPTGYTALSTKGLNE